jgi:glycosyltransferase involved in cell wall biosynthesis
MISVLHLISNLESGGAETMLNKLVAASDPERFRHLVVSMLAGGSLAEGIRRAGVPVRTLGMTRGVPNAGAVVKLVKLLRRHRPDVLQTWMYHADLLGVIGAAVVRTPVVWNVRTAFHLNPRGGGRFLSNSAHHLTRWCARLSRLPAAVVVNSEAGRQLHDSIGYRPKRWVLIGNGFDLDVFRSDDDARESVRRELGLTSSIPLIGLVARFDPHKDHLTFMKAAGLVAAGHPSVHFVLIGSDVTPANAILSGWATEHGLDGRIHMLGQRSDVPRLTSALDVASCTSIGEAFPNVVGEAMACGVPCAVTDVGDAAAIVGDTGFVVPRGDAAALAGAWMRLLAMTAGERRAMGCAARQRVAERYGLASVVREYEKLYLSLMRPDAA